MLAALVVGSVVVRGVVAVEERVHMARFFAEEVFGAERVRDAVIVTPPLENDRAATAYDDLGLPRPPFKFQTRCGPQHYGGEGRRWTGSVHAFSDADPERLIEFYSKHGYGRGAAERVTPLIHSLWHGPHVVSILAPTGRAPAGAKSHVVVEFSVSLAEGERLCGVHGLP